MSSQVGQDTPVLSSGSPGLRRVRDLLTANPHAAVAIIDPARKLRDPRRLLGASGIDIGTHTVLRGTAAAEFVVPPDARMVGDAVTEAQAVGDSARPVHLRDGRAATLYLVRVDELRLPTGFVMVIVSDADGRFADRPERSRVEAAARVGVAYVDGAGVVSRADDAAVSVLGRPRAELEGQPIVGLASPDDQEASIVHWVAAKEQRGVPQRWRCRVVRGDGTLMWAEVTITNRIDDDGRGDVRVEFNDISREVAASEALAVERSLLKELTETLPVGVAKFDAAGRIEYSNAQLTRLLGREPAGVVARAISGETASLAVGFARLLVDGRASHFVSERSAEQPDRDLEWTLRPVRAASGVVTGGVLCVADVTEATELRAALEERASTDALTGCLNWMGTVNCLQSALLSSSAGRGVGLLFIDLNGFKGINDGHGHAVGDRVLEVVARRLRSAVRPLDRIGRLGGDEFVVVAPDLGSLDETKALARRVSAGVNRVASVADVRVRISASTGAAWADSGNADDLLAAADRDMYRVKCHSRAEAARGSGSRER